MKEKAVSNSSILTAVNKRSVVYETTCKQSESWTNELISQYDALAYRSFSRSGLHLDHSDAKEAIGLLRLLVWEAVCKYTHGRSSLWTWIQYYLNVRGRATLKSHMVQTHCKEEIKTTRMTNASRRQDLLDETEEVYDRTEYESIKMVIAGLTAPTRVIITALEEGQTTAEIAKLLGVGTIRAAELIEAARKEFSDAYTN